MKTDSIGKNYTLNTLYQVFRLIIPLVTAPYIARVFGADGVGIRSYTSSYMSVFSMFAVLGTSVYGQQTIAQCRDDKAKRSDNFWGIEILSIITTLATTLCWVLFANTYRAYRPYLLMLTIQIIAAAFDVSWYFAAIERFSPIVIRNIVIKLITVALLFTVIRSREDLLLYIAIESTGILVCNLSMWVPLLRDIERVKIGSVHLKRHFWQTLIYFLPTIAASVYSYIDKTMIGLITRSTVESGYYEEAQSFIHMAFVLISSLSTVLASRIAYLFSQKRDDEIRQKLLMSMNCIFLLAIPLTFGFIGVADTFIAWFLGDRYLKVVFLLKMGSPLVVLLAFHNYLAAQYLVPSGQRAKSTIGVVVGAVINFCLNAALIPRLQSVGAIAASIVSEVTICAVYFYMSRVYIHLGDVLKSMLQPLEASIVMLLVVYMIGQRGGVSMLTTIIQIATGAALYFIMLYAMKNSMLLYILQRLKGLAHRPG